MNLNLIFLHRKSVDAIMKNLEDMIIKSGESDETINEIDPSQRKNHELLQSKYKKNPSEKPNANTSSSSSSNSEIASNSEEKSEKTNETVDFKSMKLGSLTCMAQSLSAYLITKHNKKGSEKLRTLTIKVYDSVNLWLSRLFR